MKRFLTYIRKHIKELDYILIISFLLLGILGVIMVYSASMVPASKGSLTGGVPIESNHFMKRQFLFVVIGFLVIIFIGAFININVLKKSNIQKLIIIGTLCLLLITVLIGKEINGSRNWINLGLFSLQSSEFLKLASIFYLSYIINRRISSSRDYHLKHMIPPLGVLGVGLLLVLMQGDLGGTLLTVAIIASILIYSDIKNKIKLQIMMITMVPIVFYIIYTLIFDSKNLYRLKRIKVMLDPFKYESGDGYQLTGALTSIGNGGLTGRGLGNGIAKLGYLPEPHTDFIFTVIAEELGLIGVLCTLMVYGVILFKGLIYANKAKNQFYKLICVGVVSYLFMQVFINLAGVSGLIPLTGVTLPLLSYGGSSMLSISIAFGALLAVARNINKERKAMK
ncbi:FtsW/RodA/SpoVE family cell cycle protein [Staphylococcus pseudoxylosus]|uniref:Probable peptidoglycan glycosyltransferase FtsW n=1 Tax=Staphylococcus pseudoxylosus TaxID=2282419 RepID=A0AAQ0MJ08_9STAP|nr:FtsW/RodA/SpoVE family cell cycle protein [Staphylococcus pseudoxylosus]PTI83559.1 cell division protein FtsW [Staphylococcus xylosus]MCE5002330.1 FtsW/RodA/SpoVE family cell cycle protein [Staphylococcus pseudoxylosus]MDW8545611.1 FtsW/RodA/SpoVE family cell cycle protein [Staphylococcus pseudoxylosus]MEB5781965.1 FtsW/RodA/SpoVE family cell cycle protein [Staphylococcus pseudoxylosus]MEB6331888.1 FtsW/RodA/SpoVE family cell cycle protein [Staphylococcus pseudoxylosus]